MEKVAERLSLDEQFKESLLWEHIGRYVFAAQFVEGKVVLDIACGTGYGASYLMNKGAKMVVGGDYSEEAVQYAKLHYQRDNLRFLCADAQQMPFCDKFFDVIVSFETIEHLERYEDFLKGCKRVLKDDGIFICSTPNGKGRFGYKNPWHIREFSTEELYELLAKHFGEIRLYGQHYLTKTYISKQQTIMKLKPITSLIPQSVRNFFLKFIFPERRLTTSLAKVNPGCRAAFDEIVEERHIPSLLTQDSPLAEFTTAVVRK